MNKIIKSIGLGLLIGNAICINYGLNNDEDIWSLLFNLLGMLISSFMYVAGDDRHE